MQHLRPALAVAATICLTASCSGRRTAPLADTEIHLNAIAHAVADYYHEHAGIETNAMLLALPDAMDHAYLDGRGDLSKDAWGHEIVVTIAPDFSTVTARSAGPNGRLEDGDASDDIISAPVALQEGRGQLLCIASHETPCPYVHWSAADDPKSLARQRNAGWGQVLEGFALVDFHGTACRREKGRLSAVGQVTMDMKGRDTWARVVRLTDGSAISTNPVVATGGSFRMTVPVSVSKQKGPDGSFRVVHSGLTRVEATSEGCRPLAIFVSLEQPETRILLDAATDSEIR